MVGLLKSLVTAASAYFQLRNKSLYFDKMRESRERRTKIINEIEELRSQRSNAATDRADFLQSELISENEYSKHLSSLFFKLEGRDESPD
jgi:uncharacterized coiled-coil DUF342 family protein